MAWSKNKNIIAAQAQGTFTANGASAVVFAPAVPVGANSTIIVSMKAVGGTPAGAPFVSAITTGAVGTASISFKAVAGDTSVYNVTIIG
jgi:hypothetical protein